jgi:chromosome segregation ATPase
VAEDSSRSLDELQQLQTQLVEERNISAQVRAEASTTAREVSLLKTELEMRMNECERLRSGSDSSVAAREVALLKTELDIRMKECERLRSERQENVAPSQGDVQEVASLRSQLADQRAEVERLRQQSSHASIAVAPDDDRVKRSMLRDRDDTILQMKAEAAQAAALHSQELENLRARLADARGRQSETQSAVLGDLHAQLRERAGEVERLHADLRTSAGEMERLKCEARSLDLRSTAAESAAVEAVKASTSEQWRRETKRMEDALRERDTEIAAAKEQIERAQREIRRLEVDDHRSSQRAETARTDLEHSRQEVQQLREDVIEAERRLEDVRTSLRGEHAARSQADAGVREHQREIRVLRDQLQQQAAETELLSNEARRERGAVVTGEAEIARLQQLVQTKEAELRQLRSSSDVQAQHGDALQRWRWAELGER